MDRFMMKAVMTYPTAQEEQRMLTMLTHRGSDTFDSRTLTGASCPSAMSNSCAPRPVACMCPTQS